MAVWNLGSINIDHVYRLAHMPKPGETVAALDMAHGLGGKGANQSIAAARAGARTIHLGAMGAGDEWVVDSLKDSGVGTTQLLRLADQVTGHAIILLDREAENSIIIHPGANRALTPDWLAAALSGLTPQDSLLIQNETNCQVEAAQIARQAGAQVIYSAAPFGIEALRAILPHATILAMNEGEAAQMSDALHDHLPPGLAGLLVTRGGDGAEYRDLQSGQTYHHPAFPVDPVDTTGAGDTFAGYFTAMRDHGHDIPAALRLASAAAALQVTRPGAAEAIPTLEEVEEFLRRQQG